MTEGSVGRTIQANATVKQPVEQIAVNGLSGTITSLRSASTLVNVGDQLYSVDQIPVRALQGDVPFYRDLGLGMVGTDVVQLRGGLIALGFLAGAADGSYDEAVGNAVRMW
ncbi:MAG: peptidoglycan-binding domain-containing protein, partial [Nakamurella sp.]